MIKIGAPAASATAIDPTVNRVPQPIEKDENLAENGTFAFNVQRVQVFDDPDDMCYCWFDYIEGCDLKWRGEFCIGQNYGQYRQRVKKITRAHEGFDSLADLFKSLKDKAFKLWESLKVNGTVDKYIAWGLDRLQDFDPESRADAALYADRFQIGSIESENQERETREPDANREPAENVQPATAMTQTAIYRESDICPDPDKDNVVHIPPKPRELAETVVKKTRNDSDELASVATTTTAAEPLPMFPADPTPESAATIDPDCVTEGSTSGDANDDDACDIEFNATKAYNWELAIGNAKESVFDLLIREEKLKEQLSACKKQREDAVAEMVRLESESPENAPMLYRKSKATSSEARDNQESETSGVANSENSQTSATGTTAKTSIGPSTDDDSWRSVELTSLDLSAGILAILAESGFATVGQIADHTASGKRLTDIAKVGEAKAEKIEQALEGFWASRSR